MDASIQLKEMMDLRQLRYFTVLAAHQHFGRAAAVLHIAQPALSRQVQLLEAELGVKLVERHSRGASLTREGELLLDRATFLLRYADQIREAFEAAMYKHFANGVHVVLDYLSGASARSILVAAAKACPSGVPLRFVQVGSAAGGEVALPASVLRSSAIEIMGSGLGSVSVHGLIGAINGVLRAAAEAKLSLDYRAVPLSDVSTTWADPGHRIVYVPNSAVAT